MEAKHTPEPWIVIPARTTWKVNVAGAADQTGYRRHVAECWGQDGVEEADARRIVDCVNACAGINPEAVPELLDACEKAIEPPPEEVKYNRALLSGWRKEKVFVLRKMASAAIAKAKGE